MNVVIVRDGPVPEIGDRAWMHGLQRDYANGQ